MSAAAAAPPPDGAATPAPEGQEEADHHRRGRAAAGGRRRWRRALLHEEEGRRGRRSRAAEAEGEEAPARRQAQGRQARPEARADLRAAGPFTVNLADREAERYAQIGITLEIDDAKFADQLKAYMPAIRNDILMVLAHKTSQRTAGARRQGEAGRRDHARGGAPAGHRGRGPERRRRGRRRATRPIAKPKKKKKKKKAAVHNPVRHVHFSNFIIQ